MGEAAAHALTLGWVLLAGLCGCMSLLAGFHIQARPMGELPDQAGLLAMLAVRWGHWLNSTITFGQVWSQAVFPGIVVPLAVLPD